MIVDGLGRFFDVYRRTASTRTAVALVAANAIPLIGVLFFGWSLITILVVYWVENAIVGFWNVPRIILARGSAIPTGSAAPASVAEAVRALTIPSAGRAAIALFFVIHYGLFWLGHGFFVFLLPSFVGNVFVTSPCLPDEGFGPVVACIRSSPVGEIDWSSVAIAAVALFLSHGASFLLNYVGRREYMTASAIRQTTAPYGRVVVLHLTILFGAFVAIFLGAPLGLLVILVVLKTAFDLRLHLREHRDQLGSG